MKKNRMYTIVVDSTLDERLKQFTEQLSGNEHIVSQTIIDSEHKMIITTVEDIPDSRRNLLLEETQKRVGKNK